LSTNNFFGRYNSIGPPIVIVREVVFYFLEMVIEIASPKSNLNYTSYDDSFSLAFPHRRRRCCCRSNRSAKSSTNSSNQALLFCSSNSSPCAGTPRLYHSTSIIFLFLHSSYALVLCNRFLMQPSTSSSEHCSAVPNWYDYEYDHCLGVAALRHRLEAPVEHILRAEDLSLIPLAHGHS